MFQDTENVCIIVNPEPLAAEVRITLVGNRRVIIFDDLRSMERWQSRRVAAGNVGCEVETVLREIGIDRHRLPRDIADALDSLMRLSVTPVVGEFARNGHSLRTFYRRWNAILSLRPKEFLDRVRLLHAFRLMQSGCCAKEAAALAGYGSAEQMRAHANKERP